MNKKGVPTIKPGLSAELNLLIDCCKIKLGTKAVEQLDFEIISQINWNKFIELTSNHRLFTLVNKVLGNNTDILPAEIKEEISRKSGKNLKLMMRLAGELKLVHALFASNNIKFTSLKGPLMVIQFYGNFSDRQTRDLDILVSENDVEPAIRALQKIGYDLQDTYFLKNPEKKSLYFKRENHVRLSHHEKKTMIELHWAVSKYFTTIKTESLFENAINLDFSGDQFITLNAADYLVYLSIHGVYHQFELMFWLVDIAQVLSNSKIGVDEILARAASSKCKSAVIVSLALACHVFDIDLKEKNPEIMPLTAKEQFLYDACFASMTDSVPEHKSSNRSTLVKTLKKRYNHLKFTFKMTDDFKSKIRIANSVFIKPYVWDEDQKLPRNNFLYLIQTQLRWIKLVLTGRMKGDGRIRH